MCIRDSIYPYADYDARSYAQFLPWNERSPRSQFWHHSQQIRQIYHDTGVAFGAAHPLVNFILAGINGGGKAVPTPVSYTHLRTSTTSIISPVFSAISITAT